MPLIKVQTSVADTSTATVDSLLKSLSSGLASHLDGGTLPFCRSRLAIATTRVAHMALATAVTV
ncbi:MAG: hypothetical protein AAGJ55_08985, partial [Cyanobacteria bacterium J06555_12]